MPSILLCLRPNTARNRQPRRRYSNAILMHSFNGTKWSDALHSIGSSFPFMPKPTIVQPFSSFWIIPMRRRLSPQCTRHGSTSSARMAEQLAQWLILQTARNFRSSIDMRRGTAGTATITRQSTAQWSVKQWLDHERQERDLWAAHTVTGQSRILTYRDYRCH